MSTDLEHRLRSALEREAGAVPLRGGEWQPTTSVPLSSASIGSARRSALRGPVAAAAIAVAVAAGLLVFARTRSTGPDDTPTFAPTGTEVPLTSVPANDVTVVVKPGTLAALEVEGHPVMDVFVGVDHLQGKVVQVSCILGRNDGGSCAPFTGERPQSVSRSSTVDNGNGSSNLWVWSGVPESVAFVEYREGSVTYWQRPLAGVAAFPTPDGLDDVSAVAYARDGQEVARASWSTTSPSIEPMTDPALYDDLSEEQKNSVWAVIDGAMRSCLESAEPASWETCSRSPTPRCRTG